MKLWLQRHARPLVANGLCYGRLDVAADDAATRAAAESAARRLPEGLLVWYSPLQRCERVAHVLCGLRPDLRVLPDPRLQEMDFGAWEGLTWDTIGHEAIAAWTQDFGHYRCGGAESANMVLWRVREALEEFGRALESEGDDEGLWITHAGVARCVTLCMQGIDQLHSATQWPPQALALGALDQVHVHKGLWIGQGSL